MACHDPGNFTTTTPPSFATRSSESSALPMVKYREVVYMLLDVRYCRNTYQVEYLSP